MINIPNESFITGEGADVYVIAEPNAGEVTIFASRADGQFDTEPFTVISAATKPEDRRFYLPTPQGEAWKFQLTNGATARYTKYNSRRF